MSPKFQLLGEKWCKEVCNPLELHRQSYQKLISQLRQHSETNIANLVGQIGKIYAQIVEHKDRMENSSSPQKIVDASSFALVELVKQKQPLEANFYGMQNSEIGTSQQIVSDLVLTLRGDTSRSMLGMCRALEQVVKSPIFSHDEFSLRDQEKHLRHKGLEQVKIILADLKLENNSTWDEGRPVFQADPGFKIAKNILPSHGLKKYETLKSAGSAISEYEVAAYDYFMFIPPFLIDSYSESSMLTRATMQDGCRHFMGLFKAWNAICQQRSANLLHESKQIMGKYFETVNCYSEAKFNICVRLLEIMQQTHESLHTNPVRSFLSELYIAIHRFISEQHQSETSSRPIHESRPLNIQVLLSASQNLQKSTHKPTATADTTKSTVEICISLVFLLSASMQWTSFWQSLSHELKSSTPTKCSGCLCSAAEKYRPVSFHLAKTEASQFDELLRQTASAFSQRSDVGNLWDLLLKRLERLWAVTGLETHTDLERLTKLQELKTVKFEQTSGLAFPLNVLVAKEDPSWILESASSQDFAELGLLGLSLNSRIILQISALWSKIGKKAYTRLISTIQGSSNSEIFYTLENCKSFISQARKLLQTADLKNLDPSQKVLAGSLSCELAVVISKMSILDKTNNSILSGLLCTLITLLRLSGASGTTATSTNSTKDFVGLASLSLTAACDIGTGSWKQIIGRFGYRPADKTLGELHQDDSLSEIVCRLCSYPSPQFLPSRRGFVASSRNI